MKTIREIRQEMEEEERIEELKETANSEHPPDSFFWWWLNTSIVLVMVNLIVGGASLESLFVYEVIFSAVIGAIITRGMGWRNWQEQKQEAQEILSRLEREGSE